MLTAQKARTQLTKRPRTVTLQVQPSPCPTCKGHGKVAINGLCYRCYGNDATCDACGGTGSRDLGELGCWDCSGHGDRIAALRALGYGPADLIDLHTFCDTRLPRSELRQRLDARLGWITPWAVRRGGHLSPYGIHWSLHWLQGWIESYDNGVAVVRLGLRYVVWRLVNLDWDEDEGEPFERDWEELSAPLPTLAEARAFAARFY